MPNTLIYWDVGGVLLELNYTGLYEKGAALTGTDFATFKKTYLDSKLELGVLRGVVSNEEYQARLKAMLGNPGMSREELENFVKRGWGTEMTEVVDVKERAHFKGGAGTGILSNINQFAWEYLTRTYPRMLQTFSPQGPIVCSYLAGEVKPHIKIYEQADWQARKLGFDRIILIEDKAKYLMPGIENFGWHGIHLRINQDPEEAIKQEAGHTGEVEFSDKLFVADSVGELEDAFTELSFKI